MGESADVLQLWRACYCGNVEQTQQLIEEDVDFMHRDRNGETILHMAARSDNADVLNLLLDHLDPDVHNNNGQTSLHLAASRGHIKVIKVLILADCNLDQQTKFSEMTALHLACQNDMKDVVSALLEGGAFCNIPDSIGKTPDFYTEDPQIHKLFTEHYKVCTHDDWGKRQASKGPTPANQSKPNASKKQKKTSSQEPRDGMNFDWQGMGRNEIERQTKAPSQEPQNGLNLNWQGMGRNEIDHKFKKIKINHGHAFSDEHKKRMQQNVFDRLLGGKKK